MISGEIIPRAPDWRSNGPLLSRSIAIKNAKSAYDLFGFGLLKGNLLRQIRGEYGKFRG